MGLQSDTVISSAITSTSRTKIGTISIPGGKGGILKYVLINYHGTAESGVSQGGIVELESDVVQLKPLKLPLDVREGLITTSGGIGYVGGVGYLLPYGHRIPDNDTIDVYVTLNDDQSTKVRVTLLWEK